VNKIEIHIEAAKDALILCLCSLLYLWILAFVSIWLAVAAFIGLFIFLYIREVWQAEDFLAKIEVIKGLSKNKPLIAEKGIRYLTSPLKFLNVILTQAQTEISQASEKSKEQRRVIEEELEKIKRQEIANQIQSNNMLDSISHQEFELIVLEAFARLGYKANHTSWSGDEGIDGILVKGKNKIAIQCKKQTSKVGQPALRDFLGAMKHANCAEGFFITTSSFSDPAKSFVKEKNIKLIDGKEIIEILRSTIKEDFVINGRNVSFPKKLEERICPECGSKLRKKFGARGFFWGCEKYPRCSYSEN
jgi:hypothetical protein